MAEVFHSVCALDCPDTCSLLVEIEGGRARRLRGNPDHPVTRGFLCAKVARYLEREYSPGRVLYPQRRVGAKGATGLLHMNTADAAARAIRDGDAVRLFNDRGECRLVARVDGVVAPGVLAARAVSWNKLAAGRRNVNALTSDRHTDMGAGAVFYSCLVEVQKCSS